MHLSFHILIVDDISENIQVAMSILREEGYQFSFATDGEEALRLVDENEFDLILLDIMMPRMDGYETCRRLKANARTQDIPVIFLTAKIDIDAISKGFKLGAVDYITKPFHGEELIARVKTHLELYASRQLLKQNNLTLQENLTHREKRYTTELEENQKEMIFVLTELMEATSDETGQHIRRVAEYSKLLAHYHPGLSIDDETIIYHAAPMHDIGKITIPLDILHKPGKLTDEEFNIIKTHTTSAYEMLRFSKRKFIKSAAIISLQHHEKWNGSGYPNGLKGEDIHIYARIVAIADVFDALTHKREYKDAWPIEAATEYILEHNGTQFDPQLIDIFTEHLDEFVAIAKT
ncbi:Cyclic di-GMP phosphodiesterase response regulator RpfG [Hydrogenovibrio crunogenus]|uniref:Cyclic di-GMP phosphodiesterase response regulator RpfG n=1 Tax=Hydrogenovibrio crunogenus TaxID=39765 RepID=A0A4P7P2K5_9GAMM|nr:HD domain-containing phosphohydrolase [Hydrogenovibrio crunogenus]QBZ84249.1 Cyclic di-GMP phosphodiesterase response regulator RpfG [Hydrogenovibrio crunogenus]